MLNKPKNTIELHINVDKELMRQIKAVIYSQGRTIRAWFEEKAREEVKKVGENGKVDK